MEAHVWFVAVLCSLVLVAIALMGVAKSFAFYHVATAAREYPPNLSPDTWTHHMCICRSWTFDRTVPQAEVSTITLKAERNSSIKPSRKGAVKSAKWGRQMVSCCFRVNSCPACTC